MAPFTDISIEEDLPGQDGARLELCWYLSSQQRQRIIRDSKAAGDWFGTALIVETRG